MTDTWQSVYRSLAPRYSTATLEALVAEIEAGGKRLTFGVTTDPSPLHAIREDRCEGACLIGWLEWEERNGLNAGGWPAVVSDVQQWFADAIMTLAPGRWPTLGNWWDDPRNTEAARMVMNETRLIIDERNAA